MSSNFIEDIDYGKPSIVKKKYTNPRPMLYLYRGMPEVSLTSHDFDTAKNITLETQINEVSSLSFEIPYTINRKLEVNDCEKLVKFEGEYYIIKNIDTEDNEYSTMKVDCVHESNELKGVYCTYIDLVGATPKQMFDKIMSSTMHPIDTGYGWAGTDVDINKKRHLQTENEQSVYQNLVEMAKVFNGWLEFYTDDHDTNWVYLRTKAIDNGKFIKKGIDMKSLKLTYNSEEIFTRLYPLGAVNDSTGQEVNIMKINPTGKSYVENYTYYLAKGIPTKVIDSRAMYQQLKTLRAEDYTNDKDLYEFALEELEKYCYPQLDATLTMEDLSVYVESLDEPPKIGYNIQCIDKEIEFILGCMIMGVKRNYDNPSDTTVTISNVVRYNTFYQKLEHSADTTDKITKPDNGKDGGGGIYIPAAVVKDGDHVNVSMKLNNHQSLITQNADKIALTVEDLGNTKAQIVVQADKIESTVKRVDGCESLISQNADAIEQRVTNGDFNTYKRQTDREISQKVSSGSEFSSEMKQNVDTFQFLFNEASGQKTEISKDGIVIYDGGLLIKDEHGHNIMGFGDGVATVNDLYVADGRDKYSWFYKSISGMKEMEIQDVRIHKLVIRHKDFYIDDGRDLKDYIETICYKMLKDQGLI